MIKILLNTHDEFIEDSSPEELGLRLHFTKDGYCDLPADNTVSGLYTSENDQLQRLWIMDSDDKLFMHFVVYSDNWSKEFVEILVRYILEVSECPLEEWSYQWSPDIAIDWDADKQEFVGCSS